VPPADTARPDPDPEIAVPETFSEFTAVAVRVPPETLPPDSVPPEIVAPLMVPPATKLPSVVSVEGAERYRLVVVPK
jgi:hypothetical protein